MAFACSWAASLAVVASSVVVGASSAASFAAAVVVSSEALLLVELELLADGLSELAAKIGVKLRVFQQKVP